MSAVRLMPRLLTRLLPLVLAAASAATASAASAVAEGELLFLSNRRASVFEPYRMLPDGSRVLRVLAEDGEVDDLRVSPDGRRVLYTRTVPGGHQNLFVTDLVEGRTRQLTRDELPAMQPAWSPDGSGIALVSMREGVRKIELMDADGGRRRRLTQTDAAVDEFAPSFSPDGTRIAFLAAGLDATVRVGVAALANGKPRLLNTDPQHRNETLPQWSPDGSRVLFTAAMSGGSHVVSAAADGSGVTVLTRGPIRHGEPQWSPDGRHVLFFASPSDSARARLSVARADGSEPRQLYGSDNDLLGARWSCDGSRIVLVEHQAAGGRLLSMSADGRELTPLSSGGGFDTQLQVHCGGAGVGKPLLAQR